MGREERGVMAGGSAGMGAPAGRSEVLSLSDGMGAGKLFGRGEMPQGTLKTRGMA